MARSGILAGWLRLPILAALAAFGQSGQVGDFAPLSVGNTWVYRGEAFSGILGQGRQDSLLITAKVLGTVRKGDTLFADIAWEERLHHSFTVSLAGDTTWIPETTVNRNFRTAEIRDSLLTRSGYPEYHNRPPLFFLHSAPENQVVPVASGASTFEVLCKIGIGKDCWAKGIGLTYSKAHIQGHRSFASSEFKLESFNSRTLEGPVVSLAKPAGNRAPPARVASMFHSQKLFDGSRLINGRCLR